MRVCFINPPRPWLVNPHAQAPIGILYLAAVLEAPGHEVRLTNLAGLVIPDRDYTPDVSVGFDVCRIPVADTYCLTGTWLDAPEIVALAKAIRNEHPRACILVGGPIALSPECVSDNVDLVVRGEAENEICALVESPKTYRANTPHTSYSCSPPLDLDALPFPARHLWAGPFGGNIFIRGENYFGGGSTTILGSRGCPYDCAFCASSALAPRKVRLRSAESIVEEMEQCVVDFGVRQFRFSDENFNASPKHVEALCVRIFSSNILNHGKGIAWRASVAARPMEFPMLADMEIAGCKEVSIGVESADPAVLELICPGKLHNPDEAIHALEQAKAADLRTRALMMVGTPGENADTARLNIDFMRRVTTGGKMCFGAPTPKPCCDALAVTVFTPMPGSDIYNHPERYGCKLPSSGGPACRDVRGAGRSHAADDATQRGMGATPADAFRRSICLYGPDGQHEIEPTIELDDFPLDALRASMRDQIAAAEATGKVGKG